ncbi:uncharacterized protein LOC127245359 [Andrographis paniculata]|uniref:uncharacterized protein LOC127245359 n=1 Tax=Andrographis paniculata TaxID=175694 RepID=UPI0021E6E862|nr:uncharacterized protein LOC127245359 [Andrographis paniculata]
MDYQQPHGYMRPPQAPPPPPPPGADPYQRPPPPPTHPQSNYPWGYSAPQFQYQPQTQHSPSPPPPPQWPPPQSTDHGQYFQPPYPAHHAPPYSGNPRYPLPPHPLQPRPFHAPQSQDWAGGSWTPHQSWQYPTNNNEEDWAAKARAWAAANAANNNQQGQQPQFVPGVRPEGQSHFHDQYSQPAEPQSHDGHTLPPGSNYQLYPVGHPSRTNPGQMQDSQYVSSGQPSYDAGMHAAFASRDGGLAGDSVAPSHQQEKPSISPLSYQQEVPSSYSSVAGKDEAGNGSEKVNSSAPLPVISGTQPQSLLPAGVRSGWTEETQNSLGSQPAQPMTDLSDQPLNFAPHFNREAHAHTQPIYTHSSAGTGRGGDPAVPISSNYAWNPPSVSGVVYPPGIPPIPTTPQIDHPIPVSGHATPMFPAGPGFQPTVPMIGPAFGVGTGVMSHPSAFSGDAYGVSDRPKKVSIPNWVREEIIKNKAVITSTTAGTPKEDSQSIDEDNYRKGDQADSKSIDSFRSTEDEDEDEVEAARTAAINREIKRVLTEVLLKVTDELFDEIATKVLKEGDLSIEVGQDMDIPDNHALPSTPSISTPKASAKVLVSTKTKENDHEDGSEKSTFGPGDILGLASYASDEEDEEVESSTKPSSKENATHQQLLEDNPVIENDRSQEEAEKQGNLPEAADGIGRKSPANAYPSGSVADTDNNDDRAERGLSTAIDNLSSGGLPGSAEDELQHVSGVSKLSNHKTDRTAGVNEKLDGDLDARGLENDDFQTQNRSDKNDRLESKKKLGKKVIKDSESSKERLDKKGHDRHRRHEERQLETERIDDPDSFKDKYKDKDRNNEKVKHTESRRHPSPSTGNEGVEVWREKKTTQKNDNDDRKQNRRRDEKEERSRHRSGSDSKRHKRHHSSDESSDDSKRKSRHSRRHRSPSPIRSRKRQVSRSPPHSKYSKRRHSPYSSLETSRGGKKSGSRSRSRSRSPARRRRYLVDCSGLEHMGCLKFTICKVESNHPPVNKGIMESLYSFFFSNLYNQRVRKDPRCSKNVYFLSFLGFLQVLQKGLCLVWIYGVFLIGVSFYVIQMVPISLRDFSVRRGDVNVLGDSNVPKITIFTAPKPFIGSIGDRQVLAVRSWLELSENLTVILFSQDPSVISFAHSFGSRVSVMADVDFTFLGTPYLHSIIARSMALPSDISVLIDPDIVLLPNFVSTLNYAHKLDEDWLLVALSKNVGAKKEFVVAEKRARNRCDDRMIIAWNSGDLPLHKGVLPPFLYGEGIHNRWIVSEALISDFRLVIDATSMVSSFFLDDAEIVEEDKTWEGVGNALLGRVYGSLSFGKTNFSNLFRFLDCNGNFVFVNTEQNIVYPLGYGRRMNLRNKRILECVNAIVSFDSIERCLSNRNVTFPTSVSLPLSLETLLSMRGDRNKSVVLGVAGYSYKDLLMSWVCRLRRLGVLNFLVCALDDDVYDFSVLQGLPVIKCTNSPANISFDGCHFGTDCFQKVTKVKSRMVLRILKLGYNVLLSDVDVYWFKNPLPYLSSFGPGVLVAQSDEYNATEPPNLPRRLNSGFYFARSDRTTIAAMKRVVGHAAKSNLSEQPSFYDTLCGNGGAYRLGDDRCLEPSTNLTVQFLDRDLFPNGAYQGLWEGNDTRKTCWRMGCFVLHNNWINGRKKKLERQMSTGLWEYDVNGRMCLQRWHGIDTAGYF